MHPFPIILLLCCLAAINGYTQPGGDPVRPLSATARVSVITCGPGVDMYALFGHTAIRVRDDVQGIDQVYNYGTFDFEPPDFYRRFLLGTQLYYASETSFRRFQPEYIATNRYLFEQVLSLTPSQRQRLYQNLKDNIKPANRYYRYAFFTDNCSTRPLDLILKVTGARIPVGDTLHPPPPVQLMRPYLVNSSWVSMGFQLLLGRSAYAPLTPRQQAFLPEQLAQLLEQLRVNGRPLVKERITLYQPVAASPPLSYTLGPELIAILLFLAAAFYSIADLKWRYNNPGPDAFFFCVSGLGGIVIATISLLSTHVPLQHNLHVLWLFPLHFFAGILMQFRRFRYSNWFRLYLGLSLCLQLIFLMAAPLLGIVYHATIYFLCGSLTIRCFSLLKLMRED